MNWRGFGGSCSCCDSLSFPRESKWLLLVFIKHLSDFREHSTGISKSGTGGDHYKTVCLYQTTLVGSFDGIGLDRKKSFD